MSNVLLVYCVYCRHRQKGHLSSLSAVSHYIDLSARCINVDLPSSSTEENIICDNRGNRLLGFNYYLLHCLIWKYFSYVLSIRTFFIRIIRCDLNCIRLVDFCKVLIMVYILNCIIVKMRPSMSIFAE